MNNRVIRWDEQHGQRPALLADFYKSLGDCAMWGDMHREVSRTILAGGDIRFNFQRSNGSVYLAYFIPKGYVLSDDHAFNS